MINKLIKIFGRKDKLKVVGGRSQKDRISFYSFNSTAVAIRKSDGEIEISYDIKDVVSNPNGNMANGIHLLAVPTLLILKAFVIIPMIKSGQLNILWYFVPMFFEIAWLFVAIITMRICGGKDILKNHAAEHMVVSAYRKLKKIPTIEDAKRFSRITSSCGVTSHSAFIVVQLIGFIVFATTGYVISEIILFLAPDFLRKIFPFNLIGNFAQLFTTRKPDKANLELAISAIEALEDMEN